MKRRDLQVLCRRHGLPAGGTNAALVARLAAAEAVVVPEGAAASTEDEDGARKGCLKKVRFTLEESRRRSMRLQSHQVNCSTAEAAGGSADDAVSVCAAAPVRRTTRRSSVGLGGVGAVEVGEIVAVESKQKQRSQEKGEEAAADAQVIVRCRVTRRSSLSSGVALLPPLDTEKKRGRRKSTDCSKNKSDGEAHGSAKATSPAIAENNKNGRKREISDLEVQKSAKMEASVVNRSKKRRRTTEPEQLEAELPAVLEVPKNDAPVTRTLRSRAVQVNNIVVEEGHVGQELESKRQPGRPSTCWNQQLASSVEEEDQQQVPLPNKCPPLRRSRRSILEPNVAESETKNSNGLPREVNSAKGEDDEKKLTAKEPVRRLTRRSVIAAMLEKGDNDLVSEKAPKPEARVTRAMRKSFVLDKNSQDVSEGFENAKGDDMMKEPTIKEPTRQSTRKSVVSTMLDEEDNKLKAKKSPEVHIRTLKRKSVVVVKDSGGDGEETQDANDKDVVKQPSIKEPLKHSTHKCVASAMLEEEDKSLVARKSHEAQFRRLKRKSAVPNKDKKGDAEGTHDVTMPAKRLTRKSVASAMLEKEENALIAAKKPEAHDRRSTRKTVLSNMISKENQDHNKTARNEDKGRDEEKQEKRKGLVSLSRRSIATVETINGELDQSSSSTGPLQHNGHVLVDKISRDVGEVNFGDNKGIQIVNASSDILNASSSRATTAIHIVDAETLPVVGSPTANGNIKPLDAEVFPIASSCYNGVSVMAREPQFAGQKNSHGMSTSTSASKSAPHVSDSIQESCSVEQRIQVGEEMSSDECFAAEKNIQLVTDNLDDEHTTIQVKQGAILDGTLEKSSICSMEQEHEHECRLPKEAGQHSTGNKRWSSRAEQSPLVLQSLLSQESLDDSMKHVALAYETSHTKSEVDQLKDCPTKCTTEKNSLLQPISHHDTHLVSEFNDCMYMSQQNNGIQGLSEITHEREVVSSSLSSILVDANHRKEVIESLELVCKGEGNRNNFQSEDLSTPCDKSKVDMSGGSKTKSQHLNQKEHCIEDREDQVASRPFTSDILEAAAAKCIESGVVLLSHEETEILKDDQLNSKLKSLQSVSVECGNCCLQHALLNDISVEKSLEASVMSAEESVSNACIVGNPSFDSAPHEHRGASFEEIERKMKNYVGACPSNPKELLLELQSPPSKGNIKECDLDTLAVPFAGSVGDEYAIVKQYVKVHSDSNLSQLKPNDFLDESVQCSNTGVPHQDRKNRCNGDSTEEQVGSGPWTYDLTDAATVKYRESEVDLLPIEERSKLKGKQFSMQESPNVVGLSLTNDITDILDSVSVKRVHYKNFRFGEKGYSALEGTAENSSFGLAPLNKKHKDVLFEEAVNAVNNYVGTCPSNPMELFVELQTSSETFEDVNPRDILAFPNTEREGDATTRHLDNLLGTVLSSEPASYLGPSQNLSTDEGKQGCMSVSLHEDEGLLKSNYLKDTHAHLPRDTHNIGRDINTEEVLCEKKENMESTQSSDCDILHENSNSKGYAVPENDISETAPYERMESKIMLVSKDCHLNSCQKQEVLDTLSGTKCLEESSNCQNECVLDPGTSDTKGQKCTTESSSPQLTSHIGSPQLTCHIEVLNQDQYNENNRRQTTPGSPATGMPEGALLKRSGSVVDVVSAVGSSALPNGQLNIKPVGPNMEEHHCVTDKDPSSLFDPELAGKSRVSNLPKGTEPDASNEHDIRNVAQRGVFQ